MPAAGESSSLYKIIKNSESAKADRFMPHLFQKIGVDGSEMCQGEGEKGKVFEPIELNRDRSFSREYAGESVENKISPEDLAESAYSDGFAKGESDGFTKGEKVGIESEGNRLQTVFDTFDTAITELTELRKGLYLNTEKEAVELALAIAEKVVSHEVAVNRDTVLGVLKEALEKVIDQEKIKIKINKSDLQLVDESEYHILGLSNDNKNVIIESDNTVSQGGCVIETGFGSIDARIESQLQAVGDLLRSEMP